METLDFTAYGFPTVTAPAQSVSGSTVIKARGPTFQDGATASVSYRLWLHYDDSIFWSLDVAVPISRIPTFAPLTADGTMVRMDRWPQPPRAGPWRTTWRRGRWHRPLKILSKHPANKRTVNNERRSTLIPANRGLGRLIAGAQAPVVPMPAPVVPARPQACGAARRRACQGSDDRIWPRSNACRMGASSTSRADLAGPAWPGANR